MPLTGHDLIGQEASNGGRERDPGMHHTEIKPVDRIAASDDREFVRRDRPMANGMRL